MANFPAAQWIEYCTTKAVPVVPRSLPIFCFVFFHLFFPDDLFLFLFYTVTKIINGLECLCILVFSLLYISENLLPVISKFTLFLHY